MEPRRFSSSPLVRSLSIILLLTALLSPEALLAAAPGMLKGLVTDKADGEPVIGASVMLENTTLGAATGFDGNYTIQSIPEGSYSVKVTGVGYAPAVQNITISAGETATLDLQLGETTIMASEVVVGAALYEQDRLEVPITLTSVSREEITREPSSSLDRAVESVPGVNVVRSAGLSNTGLQIRGSNTFQGGLGTRVVGIYDGFPINNPITGEIAWNTVNMNAAEKVEVIKGASSALYGSQAMGGVVSVMGSLPSDFEIKAGASLGFYDAPPDSDQSVYRDGYTPWLWNTYVGIGDKTEKFNYSLLYSHAEDDGYRKNSQYFLNDIKFKGRYDLNSSQYLQLTAYYSDSEGGYINTWPYRVDVIASPATAPGPPFSVETQPFPFTELALDQRDEVYEDDTTNRENALVGLNYVNLLSDNLSLDARLYYTRNKTRIEYNPTGATQTWSPEYNIIENTSGFPDAAIIGAVNALLPPIYNKESGQFAENSANRYGAGVRLDYQASDQHRFLFGVDGNIVDISTTQYNPVYTPGWGNFGEVQEKNASLFVQDEIDLTDRLTALLSLRYDWSKIDADEVVYKDYTQPGTVIITAPIENQSVDALSPRAALNYRVTDDIALRASWGKSFRAPSVAERFVTDAGLFPGNPNPALDKEKMTAYEAGVFMKLSDRISFDLAGYINDYEDLIESRNIGAFPNIVFEYDNIAKARIWGIETALNIRPIDPVSLSIGYAYMNAKDKSGDAGSLAGDGNPDPEWLAYRPEHTASASATWKIDDLSLNVDGRYVSQYKSVSSYPNLERSNYPGDFIVVNAGMKYKLTDNLTGSFLCKNITNEQYEEGEWFRAPGRSFILGFDFVY
ncbi:TonB-dependent receptor [Prosthecochloris sp. ZM_2]|uniref:TonB-dependent receptor n=1 Tax=Prosthecochloris sp. ZM_2 TaxID=2045206 RepID=UPI000DF85543|nr:TonB-dependent receptor [Prosthecochloris sp. ZM_2]RNA65480.1 TonB-dependent receptor [Prosthecochloris sp. ZM_2]